MPLNKGKPVVKEIDGVRCSVVESGIHEQRLDFLKKILEFNGYEVKIEKSPKKDESTSDTYTLGVTDIIFNPVISVYERKLRTPENKILTPQFWKQISDDYKTWYWKITQPR